MLKRKIVFCCVMALIGCVHKINFKQESDMLECMVSDNSYLNVPIQDKNFSPLILGRIDLRTIRNEEGMSFKSFILRLHKGFYFLTAEGFKNIWIIQPQKDGVTATYKTIELNGVVKKNPRFEFDRNGNLNLTYYVANEKHGVVLKTSKKVKKIYEW